MAWHGRRCRGPTEARRGARAAGGSPGTNTQQRRAPRRAAPNDVRAGAAGAEMQLTLKGSGRAGGSGWPGAGREAAGTGGEAGRSKGGRRAVAMIPEVKRARGSDLDVEQRQSPAPHATCRNCRRARRRGAGGSTSPATRFAQGQEAAHGARECGAARL